MRYISLWWYLQFIDTLHTFNSENILVMNQYVLEIIYPLWDLKRYERLKVETLKWNEFLNNTIIKSVHFSRIMDRSYLKNRLFAIRSELLNKTIVIINRLSWHVWLSFMIESVTATYNRLANYAFLESNQSWCEHRFHW